MSRSTTKHKMTCAPSEDSDQPEHPPSLIRVFAVRTMGSWGPNISSCGQLRLWSDWADVQADLSLRWEQRPFCWPCSKKVLNSVSSQCARGKSSVARKTEVDPKILTGEKRFKNVTLQILNFIWIRLLIKFSLYGVMLNCLCFFVLFNAVKTDTKLTLHSMGKYVII